MKVWGVYDDEIRELADEVGLRILGEYFHNSDWVDRIARWRAEHPDSTYTGSAIRREGNAYRFRLALRERLPTGELKFQKVGRWGRTSAVCWHGYREFLFALFRNFPEARVQTMLADYQGREDFLSRYAATRGRGGWNLSANQRCVCGTARERREPDDLTALWQGLQAWAQTYNLTPVVPSSDNTTSWSEWIVRATTEPETQP